MSLGVALYVTGDGEKRIERTWVRISAAGFPSPAGVPGHRPHVSLLNGEGDLALAVDLGSQLAEHFARTVPIRCDLQPVAFLAGARRIAYYPVQSTPGIRAIHEVVYEVAVSRGVKIRDSYGPGAWIPHLSISGDVPEHRDAEFRAALGGQESAGSVVFGEAGVACWERGTPLTQVALFTLSDGITIRSAGPADVDAIAACLGSLGYEASSQLVGSKLTLLANSSSDTVLVAVEPSAGVVGLVSLHVLPLFHAPGNLARITSVVVLEAHRGRGVGRALVAAAEEFAWKNDCQRIEVTSGDRRSDAHAFYEELGYRVDERRFIKHRAMVAQRSG